MLDLFSRDDGGVLDGYEALRVSRSAAPPKLIEDLEGIEAARWMASAIRSTFEDACYGARLYGPCGTWAGVVADTMPNYWKRDGDAGNALPGLGMWTPRTGHPVGKWINDVAGRLMAMPPPELLDAVLRLHGIEGSREPAPSMHMFDDGDFALLVHLTRAKAREKALAIPGISREPDLRSLWSPKLAA